MNVKKLTIDGIKGEYDVYSDGRVYSYQKKRFLPLFDNGHGYFGVNLSFVDGYKRKYIHRLVGVCFIENIHSLPEINHIDGDKSNNHVSNLEWVSKTDNISKGYENNQFKKVFDNMKSNQETWIGKKINRRTVISVLPEKTKSGNYKVDILCDCSNKLTMYYNDFMKAKHTVCRKCKGVNK